MKALITQSCPTLCNPIDYSPPGSSIHGIFQARIKEWVLLQGIFLAQVSNLYLLHWQGSSLPLVPPGGEGNGTPLQYSCLENPMDGGAWWAAVHGVAKSQTRLSDFTLTFHFHALEKEMATHSSILAWRIPGLGEPGRLPSMGSHRVGHN